MSIFATPHQLTLHRQIHYFDNVTHIYDLALLSASLGAHFWLHAGPWSALAALILWCVTQSPQLPYHSCCPSHCRAPSEADAHSPCWRSWVDFGMMMKKHRHRWPSSPSVHLIVPQRCCGCWTFDNCLSHQLTGTFAYVSHREDSTTHYHRCYWRPNWAVHLMYLKCYCPVERVFRWEITSCSRVTRAHLERWEFNWSTDSSA